jgi:hypothetical protein
MERILEERSLYPSKIKRVFVQEYGSWYGQLKIKEGVRDD